MEKLNLNSDNELDKELLKLFIKKDIKIFNKLVESVYGVLPLVLIEKNNIIIDFIDCENWSFDKKAQYNEDAFKEIEMKDSHNYLIFRDEQKND